MSKHDVEHLLARYRVSEPPPILRARIVTGAARLKTVRVGPLDYALAAAAGMLLVAWIGTGPAQFESRETPSETARRVAVEQLTVEFGGDDNARRLAELTVPASLLATQGGAQELPW